MQLYLKNTALIAHLQLHFKIVSKRISAWSVLFKIDEACFICFRSMAYVDFDDKENLSPTKLYPGRNCRGSNDNPGGTDLTSPPSPIPNPQSGSDMEHDFFKDIMGSVFKTPDKPGTPVRHFNSLTPDRFPLASGTASNFNVGHVQKIGECSKTADTLPVFTLFNPNNEDPFNSSFSKLLDLSGCSSSFARFNDADLSWNNFPNV